MKIISTEFWCIDGSIEIFHDYFILETKIDTSTQYTYVMFSQIYFLQLHNCNNFTSPLSSIEINMKNSIILQYLPENKIYFTSFKACKFVFDKLFTAYQKYQNDT